MTDLLVVAGEASGDRIAALVVPELHDRSAFGVGGPASRAAGVDVVIPMDRLGVMGALDVLPRLPAIGSLVVDLVRRVRKSPPKAALLVNFTELNARLGRFLRAHGVFVVWCAAPQVWAWRSERISTLHGSMDRLAVLLPFEEALWQKAGYAARYVGHPALSCPLVDRTTLRRELRIDVPSKAVALLPGSRSAEVRRLIGPICAAGRLLARDHVEVRIIVAQGLAPEAKDLVRRKALEHELSVAPGDEIHGAASQLSAFDAAICASGTACLEAALAGAGPVVAYKLDRVTFALARRLIRVPHIALPNILLGRRAFPELLQDDVTPARLADETRRILDSGPRVRDLGVELRAALEPPSSELFGRQVARMFPSLS